MRMILMERERYHEREPYQDASLMRCIAAWRRLGGERATGGAALGPIPFRAVLAFAEFDGLDRDSAVLLLDALEYADGERLRLVAAKAALEAARGKANRS